MEQFLPMQSELALSSPPMYRFSTLPCLILWILLSVPHDGFGKDSVLQKLQGTWRSPNPIMEELRIEPTERGWQVYARSQRDGHPIEWGPGQLPEGARVADWETTEPQPIVISLLAASGQASLRITPEADYLVVEASLTYLQADGPRREVHELVFTRTEARGNFDLTASDAGTATARIEGHPTGPAQHVASIFQVSLYGPNEASRFHSTQSLHEGFRFESLPAGTYWLFVEARGSTGVEVSPSRQLIQVKPGQTLTLPVELR